MTHRQFVDALAKKSQHEEEEHREPQNCGEMLRDCFDAAKYRDLGGEG